MKTRILSAIVMLIITVPILIVGKVPFQIFAIILAIMSMYELLKAYEKKHKISHIMKLASYILTAIIIYFSGNYYENQYVISIRFLIISVLVYFLPMIFIKDKEQYNIENASYLLSGTLLISLAFTSFITIRNQGLSYILYLALITIITDTFALVTGMLIGKHKLCSSISPKKTIEGFAGGLIMGTIIPIMFYLYVIDSSIALYIIIPITLLLSIIGQLGDLLFSSIKRQYEIKDFSNLIPGHGGILDRLDSLILVVIAYILIVGLL